MRDVLLDVSRLVWRAWRGGLPTGIDRVCLAYVEHFASRSQAVVQRKGFQLVLSPSQSDRLFALLLSDEPARRFELIMLFAMAGPTALGAKPRSGTIYLNVGHTGLNERSLPAWIARHRLRAVYLVHDLIPLTHPQFCRDGEAEKHGRRMENVLASAEGLIGNSQATLDEMTEFAQARGFSMPPSTVAWISSDAATVRAKPLTLPRPHFITVGTIEGRKNPLLLLDVWRKLVADLGDEAPVLLIVGQRGWQAGSVFEQLDRLGELDSHVRELPACDDEELAGWIAGARALLMPSFAEGFGLPIVEALRLGTPVIASNLPALREIGRGIPTYADPMDSGEWKGLVRDFTGDTPERARQLAQMVNFRAPTWTEHFATVEQWLTSLPSQPTNFGLNQQDTDVSGLPRRTSPDKGGE